MPEAKVNKILLVTLSNIGDAVLTLPVLDCLKANFPEAAITVLAGPRPKEIFAKDPALEETIAYDKHSSWQEKFKLLFRLEKKKFDVIVDLKNSIFGLFLSGRYKTSPFLAIPQKLRHMKDRHLFRLASLNQGRWLKDLKSVPKNSLFIGSDDKNYIDDILSSNGIEERDSFIVLSAGARSHIKRWPQENFRELIVSLADEFKAGLVLVGDKEDVRVNRFISGNIDCPVADLTAKTSLAQLAYLFKRAKLLVTNDSASLHVASYMNIPVVAIFGPTDESRYGPWSQNWIVVKKDIFCRPCSKAQCRLKGLKCMRLITKDDVLKAVRKIWSKAYSQADTKISRGQDKIKRILVVRTDKIGDVLLSTPVLGALRKHFPSAFIAMMVSPYSQDIALGNPNLDEVIIYDKDGRHKNWLSSVKFAWQLRKNKFDLCLLLHPTNRVHLTAFLAGIPRRIGYDRKLGFLLTDRIRHTKESGHKHEMEYNLDLVRYLGIAPGDSGLFMPLRPESEIWVERLLQEAGIEEQDKLLAIHPAASCQSKIWPAQNFALVADSLAVRDGYKVIIVAGPTDVQIAEAVAKGMRYPAINLAGRTSLSQLASLLKRCNLFISNDSGPIHLAAAVGTPVIAIFGRKQKGLSPTRWGPLGKNDIVLHKDLGCLECLAHNCLRGFACIKAITPEDVLSAARLI